jgi:hypothetical protein
LFDIRDNHSRLKFWWQRPLAAAWTLVQPVIP